MCNTINSDQKTQHHTGGYTMYEFNKEQMDFARQIETEIIDANMSEYQRAEYLKKTYYCGWLDDLFRDFWEFNDAVRAAEFEMLYR